MNDRPNQAPTCLPTSTQVLRQIANRPRILTLPSAKVLSTANVLPSNKDSDPSINADVRLMANRPKILILPLMQVLRLITNHPTWILTLVNFDS